MNKLSKSLLCIQMRSGVELWVEKDRIENLGKSLQQITSSKFIQIGEEYLNTADIVGIFNAKTMSELSRRKNGQWLCNASEWHDRGEKCQCTSIAQKNAIRARERAIKACGKCTSGFINTKTGVSYCECVENI